MLLHLLTATRCCRACAMPIDMVLLLRVSKQPLCSHTVLRAADATDTASASTPSATPLAADANAEAEVEVRGTVSQRFPHRAPAVLHLVSRARVRKHALMKAVVTTCGSKFTTRYGSTHIVTEPVSSRGPPLHDRKTLRDGASELTACRAATGTSRSRATYRRPPTPLPLPA